MGIEAREVARLDKVGRFRCSRDSPRDSARVSPSSANCWGKDEVDSRAGKFSIPNGELIFSGPDKRRTEPGTKLDRGESMQTG